MAKVVTEQARQAALDAIGAVAQDSYEVDDRQESFDADGYPLDSPEGWEGPNEPLQVPDSTEDLAPRHAAEGDDEDTDVDLDDSPGVFQRVMSALRNEQPKEDPSQSRITQLEQQLAEMRGALNAKIQMEERQIQPQRPPGDIDFQSIYSSPDVAEAFVGGLGLDEDQKRELLHRQIAQARVMQEHVIKPQIEALKREQSTVAERSAEQQRNTRIVANWETALGVAERMGGLEAEIVKDYRSNGGNSFLVRQFADYPAEVLNSPSAIANVISASARRLDLMAHDPAVMAAGQESRGQKAPASDRVVGSRQEVTAAMSKAVNHRGSKPTTEALSPEEQIRRDILGARAPAQALWDRLDRR